MGLNELLGLAHFGFPWGGVLGQGVANAVVGIVILQAIELLPGAIERRQEKTGGEFRACGLAPPGLEREPSIRQEERKVPAARIGVFQVAVIVGFVLLAGTFWFFQIIQHERFREMAENNHQRELVLARPARRALRPQWQGHRREPARPTTSRSSASTRRIWSGRFGCWPRWPGSRNRAFARSSIATRAEPSYRPIVVIQDATLAQVAAIMARRLDFELPDVVVERVPTRRYPTDAMAAHLLGYVGEATDAQVDGRHHAEDRATSSGRLASSARTTAI